MKLCSDNLRNLDKRLAKPTYNRDQVRVGIVHFGVGGFHRSHQAVYLDRLMGQGQALDWGICGVGVMPADQAMRDALVGQDGLYTVITRQGSGEFEARVVGSIVDYLYAPHDPEAVLKVLTAPQTRIVSLTVTEGGYNIDLVTTEFDASNAAIQADLVPGALPRTFFGYIVEALRRRRDLGVKPFTVMSCDNIQGNGQVARSSTVAFAALRDPALAEWVESK